MISAHHNETSATPHSTQSWQRDREMIQPIIPAVGQQRTSGDDVAVFVRELNPPAQHFFQVWDIEFIHRIKRRCSVDQLVELEKLNNHHGLSILSLPKAASGAFPQIVGRA